MKLVHLCAAVTLTFAAIACGSGDDAIEGASSPTMNGVPPSKETTGARIVIPGTSTTVPTNGASAGNATSSGGGAASEDAPGQGASNDTQQQQQPTGGEGSTGTTTQPEVPAQPQPEVPAQPQPPQPQPPAKPLYVPPECDADCVAHDIPGVIARASKKYNIPRWFYYAVIRRESTFDRCKTQPESAPNKDWGRGLTQVTFPWYAGFPYPQHLSGADNAQTEWRNNMGLDTSFGAWIDMKDITPMSAPASSESNCRNNPKPDDAYDPKTNLDRFSSGFAAPAYHLFHVAGESPETTLRKVAYHWHYGIFGSKSGAYPADPRPYLTCATCYDTHVNEYKAPVEKDDGVWAGPTCKPPYSDSGC